MVEKHIDLVWVGSRTGDKCYFKVGTSMTIDVFKELLWCKYHGEERLGMDKEFHDTHNVMLKNSGKILSGTFEEMGMTDDGGIPFEITFVLRLDGGGTS